MSRVTGEAGLASTSTIEHRFTTAGASLLYVDRAESGDDEVLRAAADGAGRGEVVHRAPGIQHAVPVEGVLVVARDGEGGTSVLESVDARSGRTETLRLPAGVRVDRVIAPGAGTTIALVLSPASGATGAESLAPRTLALLDIGGDRQVRPLADLDDEPLTAQGAWFLPDGARRLERRRARERGRQLRRRRPRPRPWRGGAAGHSLRVRCQR